MSAFIGYLCLMFAGALITLYLTKMEVIELNKNTNAVTPSLVWLLMAAVYIGLKVMGI